MFRLTTLSTMPARSLNDLLFALVLTAAAAVAGLLAAGIGLGAGRTAQPTAVALERVTIVARREAAATPAITSAITPAIAPVIALPRVVITARRPGRAAVAQAEASRPKI